MRELPQKICAGCGDMFIVFSPTDHCKECNHARRLVAKRKGPGLLTLACARCGGEFTSRGAPCCPPCNKIMKAERRAIRRRNKKYILEAQQDIKAANIALVEYEIKEGISLAKLKEEIAMGARTVKKEDRFHL